MTPTQPIRNLFPDLCFQRLGAERAGRHLQEKDDALVGVGGAPSSDAQCV
jgi:hypothetical protein